MTSQPQVLTAQVAENNQIFNVSIKNSGEYAQNIVAAHLGLLTKSLQKLQTELRKAEMQFTEAMGNSEKSAANAQKAAGTCEAIEAGVTGGLGVIIGGASMWDSAGEAGKCVGFQNEASGLAKQGDEIHASERAIETGGAVGGTPEALAARREQEVAQKAEVGRKKEKLQDDKKDLSQRREDSTQNYRARTEVKSTLNAAASGIVRSMTQPATANENAKVTLEKANSQLASASESVVGRAYDATGQVVSGAQSGAAGVYGSSRAVAGG